LKTAFIFPGQGSQKAGMGKNIYENFEAARSVMDSAAKALGFDLKTILFEGPEEKLKLTEIAQPAILTVSIATLKAFDRQPDIAAGHSLGEYSALVCAGAVSFEDAVRIVNKRGKFMQEAVPAGKGAMAAVLGLDREKVIDCCKKAGSFGIVEAANFNCPGQTVISGETAALAEAGKLLKEAGAKRVLPLAVSAPFHSSLMKSAAEKLKAELDRITVKDARIPVISNVTALPVTKADEIKDLLVRQVTGAVLWEDCVRNMAASGVEAFVEIGCGKVLTGLVKKTSEHAKIYNIEDAGSIKEFVL